MCDSFYIGRSDDSSGESIFAKNSDRHPDEAQTLILTDRRRGGGPVQIGGQIFPFVDRGYAYALSKPSWLSGGEMGLNEAGLALGNEAVFSRFAAAPRGVLGMDLLRAVLCSADSAEEAVKAICEFVETHDQGGNGAYRGTLVYSNSYLIADAGKAFVVETAGRRWAWKAIEGTDAISNAYSLVLDYKRLDALTRKDIAPVNERAACADEADAGRKGHKESWRGFVESPLHRKITKADKRRSTALTLLGGSTGGDAFDLALATLRSHEGSNSRAPLLSNLGNLCVHAGGLLSQASTASLVVEYLDDPVGAALLWFTGTSYPCLSLYKPLLLTSRRFFPLWTEYDYHEASAAAERHWQRQRNWLRHRAHVGLSREDDFQKRRVLYQGELRRAAREAAKSQDLESARTRVNTLVREWYAGLGSW